MVGLEPSATRRDEREILLLAAVSAPCLEVHVRGFPVDADGSIQALKVTIKQEGNVRGWIDIYLAFNQTEHHLKASYAFPPLDSLMQFLRDM